ncbi:hypothetical protein [Roseovarius ramblicola]|uniref:Alpha/beta hydrolase family protein n=1 Tax=Roseovarius ramblicola TaxID=2022336 RepID=A0ABV5I1C1_9RHOB
MVTQIEATDVLTCPRPTVARIVPSGVSPVSGRGPALRSNGRGDNIMISRRPGIPGRIPDAVIIEPRQSRGERPLVSVHGIARDVPGMADGLANAAQATGRTIVLPVFDKDHWPRYQRAACPARADHALLALLSSLEAEGRIPRGPVDMSGFSGGAQFAHRFTWLYPNRVARLSVASAGWWTFPDQDTAYPFGIGPERTGPSAAPFCFRTNLRAFLDRDIAIRVGARDCVVDDKTRSGPRIDAQQGRDRLTRARTWATALRAASRALNMPDRVDFAILPDCGHSFTDCADAGLTGVFLDFGHNRPSGLHSCGRTCA